MKALHTLFMATAALAAAIRPALKTSPYDSHPSNDIPSSPYRPMSSHRPTLPQSDKTSHSKVYRRSTTAPDPVQQLLSMAPTSNTCAGALFPQECTTSTAQTVNAILAGFTKYDISTAPEQAALLSWMVYESADFKYNHNHFPAPGVKGQGTRCMMSPGYVSAYASSIPELAGPLAQAGSEPDKILALVQPDEYSFAAASWYYATQCGSQHREAVKMGGQANWENAFVTGCVGTTVNDARVQAWKQACLALGVAITP